MNPIPSATRLVMAALLGGVLAFLSLPAAAAESKKSEAVKTEDTLLREAYGILEKADHDYQGHRHAAMHEIEEAAKHLGLSLHGDGKAHERQPTSDAQIREARNMLEKAHTALAGHKNKKVPKHIEAAVKELDTALAVK